MGGDSHRTHLYKKPDTKRIDALPMPRRHELPKFQQFDDKSNPKQHITHFIEACSNAGTEGEKQFM